MKFKYVFFDLDGTLTDPFEGISTSVKYALGKMGIVENNIASLRRFIGPPLVYSFMTYYGMDREQADRAVAFYRETYGVKGIYQNVLYPGMDQLLPRLCDDGRRLFIATSKPTKYAKVVTDYFDITRYFEHIEGAPLDHSDVKKSFLMENIIKKAGITDKSACVMIGDTVYDMDGAREAGIPAIGAAYGYGTREELKAAGAFYVADSVYDLISLFKEDL